MGTEQFGPYIAARASADLSSKQYHAVTLDSSGEIQVATSGVGLGILVDDPGSGQVGTVQVAEGAKWVAEVAFNPGVYLTSSANGKAQPAAAGDERLAFAKEGASASGEVVSVQLVHAGQT